MTTKRKNMGRTEPTKTMKIFDIVIARNGFEERSKRMKLQKIASKENIQILFKKYRGRVDDGYQKWEYFYRR